MASSSAGSRRAMNPGIGPEKPPQVEAQTPALGGSSGIDRETGEAEGSKRRQVAGFRPRLALTVGDRALRGQRLPPRHGLEPSTFRLTAQSSAIELLRSKPDPRSSDTAKRLPHGNLACRPSPAQARTLKLWPVSVHRALRTLSPSRSTSSAQPTPGSPPLRAISGSETAMRHPAPHSVVTHRRKSPLRCVTNTPV
jgi:hypothetical protein